MRHRMGAAEGPREGSIGSVVGPLYGIWAGRVDGDGDESGSGSASDSGAGLGDTLHTRAVNVGRGRPCAGVGRVSTREFGVVAAGGGARGILSQWYGAPRAWACVGVRFMLRSNGGASCCVVSAAPDGMEWDGSLRRMRASKRIG